MDVRVGLWRKLSAKELMLLNCGVGEDSWESLGLQEIQPVHSEDQPWDFFGRNDAKAETPVLWPPDVKSWLIGKDSDAGRDWGQEEKGMTEDETAGRHHWLDGRESGWTPGVGDGQGGLACCDSWELQRVGHDWVTELNWTDKAISLFFCRNFASQREGHDIFIVLKGENLQPWTLYPTELSFRIKGEIKSFSEAKPKRVHLNGSYKKC